MKKRENWPIIYAFIDSQNLNLGTSKSIYKNGKRIYKGWDLDYKKFRKYLTDKFKVKKAILFIGYIKKYREMYRNLKSYGYELVFKPTVKDNHGKPKGNVDAELVSHAATIEFPNYDKALIVSGDGDFYCLHDYLEKKRKLLRIIIPNTKSESSLLAKFHEYKTFIIFEKDKLELKPKKNGRRRS
ncbi:MAG: NYN domain-containing protein [Patescibacteria group bacterium]